MAVLINQDTGLAEDLTPELVKEAISKGTHHVPLNDEEGNPVTAPFEKASELLNQGYTQPDEDQLKYLLKSGKYLKPEQQVKAAAESALSTTTFGGSTALETALKIAKPEDIRARQEFEDPLQKFAAEAAGLMGSSLIPGEGAALGKIGEMASGALGGGLAGSAAKVASESAAMQLGDEISKHFYQDPSSSIENAIPNIGLAGAAGAVLGGGLGVASKAWQGLRGTELGKALQLIKEKAAGIPEAMPKEWNYDYQFSPETLSNPEILQRTGIDVPPIVKAVINGDPEVRRIFQTLQESSTVAGKEAQDTLQEFKKQAADGVAHALGVEPSRVDAIAGMSENDAGQEIMRTMSNEIKNIMEPLANTFEENREKFANTPVGEDLQNNLRNKLLDFQASGPFIYEGTPQNALLNNLIFKWIPSKSENVNDLRNIYKLVSDNTRDPSMWELGRGIKQILRDYEDRAITRRLMEEAPELIESHNRSRADYHNVMNYIDSLNDRLHVGNYEGPKSFLKFLGEMKPEDVLRRMTPKNDADLLTLVKGGLPQTSELLRKNYTRELIDKASKRTSPNQVINPKTAFSVVNEWSPELRSFTLSPAQQGKLEALQHIIEQIPERMNTSGTAKTLTTLLNKWPAGLAAMASMATGHNPIAGYVLGELARMTSREVPDAMKLSLLKFLGSEHSVNPSAFKSAVDLVSSIYKGDSMAAKAAKSVFDSSINTSAHTYSESEKSRNKLKSIVDEYKRDPSSLMKTGGDTGYYMPEHGAALSSMSARAIQYLAQNEPVSTVFATLDEPLEPSQVEKFQYDRLLDIANQPLITLQSIKDNDLTEDDMKAFVNMYPGLYKSVSQKVYNAMIEHKNEGKDIPYDKVIGLSLFLGQPLDSTLTTTGIALAQPSQATQAAQAQVNSQKQPKGTMQKLGKSNSLMSTPLEARLQSQVTHHA